MVRNIADMLSSVMSRTDPDAESDEREVCLVCDMSLVDSELYRRYNVCPRCRFHYSFTARERIDTLADPGSFKEINRTVTSLDPLSFSSRTSYRQSVFRDQRRTGADRGCRHGHVLHRRHDRRHDRPRLRLHGRHHGMRRRRKGGPGLRVRHAAQDARCRRRHQRRRPHPRGRPLPHADGEDRHGGPTASPRRACRSSPFLPIPPPDTPTPASPTSPTSP